MAPLNPHSCKAHVLRRYPDAVCLRRKTGFVDRYEYDVCIGELHETVIGSSGSAKAAWHYAYAWMVTHHTT